MLYIPKETSLSPWPPRLHKSDAAVASPPSKSAAETWTRGRWGLRGGWILKQVSVLAWVSVRVPPQVRRRHGVLPGLTDSPPRTRAKLFFKRFVNSSQEHTLCGFYCIKASYPKTICVQKKRKKERMTPPSVDISTDGSLNRKQSSDASLCFDTTVSCCRCCSLHLQVQQALTRLLNAGTKKEENGISRLWKSSQNQGCVVKID